MDSGLCSRCQNFNIQAFNREGFAYRGYPLAAVIRSALGEDRCSFCSMLLEHLTIADGDDKESFLSIATRKQSGEAYAVPWFSMTNLRLLRRRAISATYGPVWVHFSVSRADLLPTRGTKALNIVKLHAFISPATSSTAMWMSLGGATPSIHLNLASDPGTPAHESQDITGRLASEAYNWSWSYLEPIQAWHKKCRKNHPECSKTLSQCETFDVENVPLPNRCFEISLADPQAGCCNLNSLRFKLCQTEGQTGKYIVLSHRWDDSTYRSRTLCANYACRALQCGHHSWSQCNLPSLSPLFCDVAHLALHLGIRYIWIDSLCIIQDDKSDWRREAVRMADYYQRAWLTIAATAPNEHGGLFRPLQAHDLPRVTRLPYRDGETGVQRGHFYAQAAGNTALAVEYRENVGTSTLLGRGWVYQEWMLSRRLLAFSGSNAGVFMQCQGALPQTVQGDTVRHEWAKTGEEEGSGRLVDKAFKLSTKFRMGSVGAILGSWETAVEAYSSLQLTNFEEDRLVALAGIAKEFGAALQAASSGQNRTYRYASGLWIGYIRGLLWEQAETGERVRVKGIPTWSWASIATRQVGDDGKEMKSGTMVQWAKPSTLYDMPKTLCAMETINMIPVKPKKWRPQFHLTTEPEPGNLYGNDSRFALIRLRGRLLPIIVDGPFASTDDATAAARLTNHSPDFGWDMWRRAALIDIPGEIVGWASIEHPDYQGGEDSLRGSLVYAFFISSISKVSGGYGFGNWLNRHMAYQVLFLREVAVYGYDHCYERLGVGRLFGNEVESAFETQCENVLWLV